MIRLTPRQSKAAALAILVMVALLAVALVSVPLWLLNRRYDTAVEDAANRLERYSRVVGMRDGLLKRGVEGGAAPGTTEQQGVGEADDGA